MVYGKGAIKDNFLKDGIKYDTLNFVMHANAHNFEVENVEDDVDDVQETRGVKKENKKGKKKSKAKKGKKSNGEYSMKSVVIKVMCPGSYVEPGNVDKDGEDGDNEEDVDDVAEA